MLWVRRCRPQSPKAEQGLRLLEALLCAKAPGLATAIPVVATRWQQRDSSVLVGNPGIEGEVWSVRRCRDRAVCGGSTSLHFLTISMSVLRSLETLT